MAAALAEQVFAHFCAFFLRSSTPVLLIFYIPADSTRSQLKRGFLENVGSLTVKAEMFKDQSLQSNDEKRKPCLCLLPFTLTAKIKFIYVIFAAIYSFIDIWDQHWTCSEKIVAPPKSSGLYWDF